MTAGTCSGDPSGSAAFGSRVVAIRPVSSTNIAAWMENSRVKEPGRAGSTRWPPIRPPTPRPRFCRKNCVANARVREDVDEQSTTSVARAGCITA
ncbi:hypothetical protein M2169_003235 [Streptomyces sp. MJP52]|nr:hypothetical protein [Streptomyces sp. MJP52]